MSKHRPITVTRPVYARPAVTRSGAGNSSPTPQPRMRTHAAEHTTTTNVVSVVCDAVHERAATHASEADTVLKSALRLPAKERKELLDRLLLEQQTDSTRADRDVDLWADAVHRELTQRLGSSDGGLVGIGVVRKVVAAGGAWKPVESFMQSAGLSSLTVTERQKAYVTLARLLVRHAAVVASRSGAPLSAKLVSQCSVNLPGVFEDSFPGYLQAGLAKVIVRQVLS